MKHLTTSTLKAPPPFRSLRVRSAILLSLLIHFGFVSAALARTPLFKEEPKPAATAEIVQRQRNESPRPHGNTWTQVISGNPIVLPSQPVSKTIDNLLPGRIERAFIPTSVQAFGGSKAPVQAKIVDQKGRDIFLLGEATLEPNSKRILIQFEKAIVSGTDEVFELKAHALDMSGTFGLKGNYVSGEAKYFTAEFLASVAAGFTDASISRSTNVLGNQTEERSIDTSGKKALGSALSRTADRFAEKVRAAPEYSILEGPTTIQVLIVEQPRRKL